MASTLNDLVYDDLGRLAAGDRSDAKLNNAFRLLAKWRSSILLDAYLRTAGTKVWSGVFKDMDFLSRSAEGCHLPKLLGCYEQPLQPAIEAAIAETYAQVVNIGCAEGYYAVGMARRMSAARVLAYDIEERARTACAALAAKNGVGSRVTVGSLFRHEDFATVAGPRTLVVCDIEGAERELLDPSKAPALAAMDLIVEVHEGMHPGLMDVLRARFAGTHTVEVIADNGGRSIEPPPAWLKGLSHMDQLVLTWEWRSGPTPWLVLKVRDTAFTNTR